MNLWFQVWYIPFQRLEPVQTKIEVDTPVIKAQKVNKKWTWLSSYLPG